AHMSLTFDPRDVPDDMLDALLIDPEIAALQRRRDQLKMKIQTKYVFIIRAKGTATEKEYQCILASIDCAEKKRRRVVQEEYRRDYFLRRHTKEVERQLNGIMEEYVEPVVQYQRKERTRLQRIICDFPEHILQRRIDAINQLSHRREVQRRKEPRATHPQD
ncbi:hypothetical protein V8E54_011233, partial [Elaphomyces granulatus]